MSGPTLLRAGFLRQVVVNNRKYGPTAADLKDVRPVDHIMKWCEPRIGKSGRSLADRILILESSTGSGKSTVLPPEYYHRFFESQYKNIACTQPRVLTSVEIPSQSILPYHTREALDAAKFPSRKPLELGKNLGYQNSVLTKKPVRGIIYMTVGVLMQQLSIMSDEDFMKKYGVIFLDEAHERSIGLDITIYLLKRFIDRNYKSPECPLVIIMSATLDVGKFADYMMGDLEPSARYSNIISVEGFTFPIEDRWTKQVSSNYCADAINRVLQIHTAEYADFLENAELAEAAEFIAKLKKEGVSMEAVPVFQHDDKQKHGGSKDSKLKLKENIAPKSQADILIFVNGASDLKKIKKGIERLNKHPFFQRYPIMPLELTSDAVTSQNPDYRALFQDASKLLVPVEDANGTTKLLRPYRRVIVSTNVAETGVTIDTLKHVIDTGFYKSAEFNPTVGVSMLVNKPVTQSMHRQRRGRVGRKGPGVSHSIFSEDSYQNMHVMQYPDIAKDQITQDLLTILIREYDTEGVFQGTSLKESIAAKYESVIGKAKPVNIRELGLLDSPSADSLHFALDKLFLLGFIDAQSKPTRLGIIASKFRFVNLECIKMILSGFAWGASIIDLVTLAAFLQFPKTALFANMREADFLHSLRQNEFSLFESDNDRHKMQKSEQSRMFVADDFIRLLLIFREVNDKISELKPEGAPNDDDSSDDDLPKKTIVMAVPAEPSKPDTKDESKLEPLAFETPSGPVPTVFMGPKDTVGENTSLDTSENTASSDKIRDLEDEGKKEENVKQTSDTKDQAVKGGDFASGIDSMSENGELAEESSSDDEVYFGGGKPFNKHSPTKSFKPMKARTPLEQYLGDRGMIASGFTQIVERRDEIIHMLASMGFNPYQGWRESLDQVVDGSETEKLAFVKKIKQCLYEGFRNNVAVWDAAAGTFRTLKSHLKLPIESDLMRFQPKFLIYDSILMTGDSINMYEAKLNYLGVLDGFVEVDINFEALISQT